MLDQTWKAKNKIMVFTCQFSRAPAILISRSLPPSTHSFCDCLRLVQSQSTGASFFVTRADGIDDRVKKVNKTFKSTIQAQLICDNQDIYIYILYMH